MTKRCPNTWSLRGEAAVSERPAGERSRPASVLSDHAWTVAHRTACHRTLQGSEDTAIRACGASCTGV